MALSFQNMSENRAVFAHRQFGFAKVPAHFPRDWIISKGWRTVDVSGARALGPAGVNPAYSATLG
jgi:hypothetical protein